MHELETMPRRKLRTYGYGVLGVTPGSDVTQETMSLANAGTTAAAALGRAVPCLVGTVIKRP
jgi:hypothetical protein